MFKENTKIREIKEITNESIDFMRYFSKKTINSLLEEKTIEKLVKAHILVL